MGLSTSPSEKRSAPEASAMATAPRWTLSTNSPRVTSTRMGLAKNRLRGYEAQLITQTEGQMRGYFAVGADGLSKPMNLGNLLRIAHAFGASFFFTVAGRVKLSDAQSDTSRAAGHLPVYQFASAQELRLPQGCRLVGVEISDDAIELPRFKHPLRAAYVFGAERMSLSPEMVAACEFVVKIPTKFSINVGMAGAIVMYAG